MLPLRTIRLQIRFFNTNKEQCGNRSCECVCLSFKFICVSIFDKNPLKVHTVGVGEQMLATIVSIALALDVHRKQRSRHCIHSNPSTTDDLLSTQNLTPSFLFDTLYSILVTQIPPALEIGPSVTFLSVVGGNTSPNTFSTVYFKVNILMNIGYKLRVKDFLYCKIK